jgi:hypothetical protein
MDKYFSNVKKAFSIVDNIQQLTRKIEEPGVKLELINEYLSLKHHYNNMIDFFNNFYNKEMNGNPLINDEIKADIVDHTVKILTELKKQYGILPIDLCIDLKDLHLYDLNEENIYFVDNKIGEILENNKTITYDILSSTVIENSSKISEISTDISDSSSTSSTETIRPYKMFKPGFLKEKSIDK